MDFNVLVMSPLLFEVQSLHAKGEAGMSFLIYINMVNIVPAFLICAFYMCESH